MLYKTLDNNLISLMMVVFAASWMFSHVINASAKTGTFNNTKFNILDFNVDQSEIVNVPQIPMNSPIGSVSSQPICIEANEIHIEKGTNLLILFGNVQFIQGEKRLFSDRMKYDTQSHNLIANGNVQIYAQDGNEISADDLNMNWDSFIGKANNVNMKLANTFYQNSKKSGQRISAETLSFVGSHIQSLTNASMSSCPIGNDDVVLLARKLELNQEKEIGRAKSMTLKFKGLPIFYFPNSTFPLGNDRNTGFLSPIIGYRTESGYIIGVPFYVNIAPNHDATIVPRLLNERGVQIYGQYRYLTEHSEGSLNAEILPADQQMDKDRYQIRYEHLQNIGENWRATVAIQDISDSSYLTDFSNSIDMVTSNYIEQKALLTYSDSLLRMKAQILMLEAINNKIMVSNQPYSAIPELSVYVKPKQLGIFNAGFRSTYSRFKHVDTSKITGSRFRLTPYLSCPLKQAYGYIIPKLSFQSIHYFLDENADVTDMSLSLSVPMLSVDSMLLFQRTFKRSDIQYLQTLEPRLFYVNIPAKIDQAAFPNFDTGIVNLTSFGHFFRENQFFSGDRIGDTHQLSVGLTSRIVNNHSGEEKMVLQFAKLCFLDNRPIGLTMNTPADQNNRSNLFVKVTASLSEYWNFQGVNIFSSENNNVELIQFSAEYSQRDRKKVSISYTTYRLDNLRIKDDFKDQERDQDEQIKFEVVTPIAQRWNLEAEVNYSIITNEARSAALGINFDGCCWAVEFGAKRVLDLTGCYTNRFILSFALDDLGRNGSNQI